MLQLMAMNQLPSWPSLRSLLLPVGRLLPLQFVEVSVLHRVIEVGVEDGEVYFGQQLTLLRHADLRLH